MRRSVKGGVLVIGYGNDLRGEDCAGRLAADSMSRWNYSDVEVMSVHQLGPELVWKIAEARLVVFVDAFAADQPYQDHPVLIKLHPTAVETSISHGSDPVTLLLLSRELCGRCPPAYMVGIPARRFEIGDELSDMTRDAISEAVDLIKMLTLWKLRTLPVKRAPADRLVPT